MLGISGPRSSLGGRSLWFHVLSGEGRLRYLWSQVPRGISGGGVGVPSGVGLPDT